MKRFKVIWLALCAALLARGVPCRGDDDMGKLKQQAAEFELAGLKGSEAQADRWAAALSRDGSWPDIDYKDQSRGFWKTAAHLKRTLAIAASYSEAKAAGRREAGLEKAALAAAHYWISHDFQNPNWWQNEIGTPRDMVAILLLMADRMSVPDKADALKIAGRATISMTGQNRVWKAGIVFDRALVEEDTALARQARDAILNELKVTTDEGLQPDDSFHQHGPQQQMGNYGLSFATDMVSWAGIWRGTALAIPGEKMALLRGFLLRGEAVVTMNGAMDISGCGRQLFVNSAKSKGRTSLALLAKMEVIDPEYAADYRTALAQDLQPAGGGPAMNKNFFRSDYMVHRRPGFYASVKVSSNRVIGEELVNAENLSGRYLADGATFLYQTGNEYADIFPVWDWRRVPGVTCVTTGTTLAPEGKMETDFAGGVSCWSYGAEGLDYHRDGVSGKKGWFFLDEGVVCLGAGITGTTGAVRTSIDQRLAEGATLTPDGALAPGVRFCKEATWVLNGREGYLFAQPQDVWAGTQTQRGTWKNVYASGPGADVSKEVFSIWIDHPPGHGSYAYLMIPGATVKKLQQYAATPPVEILSNTPDVQAVRDGTTTEILFYKPGKLEAGNLTVSADGACAVSIGQGKMGGHVADPTQKQLAVTLTINGAATPVKLPAGPLAGSTVRTSGGL